MTDANTTGRRKRKPKVWLPRRGGGYESGGTPGGPPPVIPESMRMPKPPVEERKS